MNNTLDPQVVSLAQSIRQVESGGNWNAKGASGESGAYQWTPDTWKAHAQTVLGDQNAEMSPSNQNAVAYSVIKQWKDEGLNPAEIAAKWNSGSPKGWENKVGVNSLGVQYDVPSYVKKVTDAYQTFKQQNIGNMGTNQGIGGQQNTAQQGGNNGVLFPFSPTDSPLTAGLKAAGNLPTSALKFGVGAVQSLNPLQTASNIGQIGSGFSELASQEGVTKALWDVVKGLPAATYETLVPDALKQLFKGNLEGAAKSATEDPFGTAAPIVLAAEGGARAIDRVAGTSLAPAVDAGISKLASPVIGTAEALGRVPVKLATSGFSHLTGLDPSTITKIVQDPAAFSRAAQESISRSTIAEDFGKAIDQVIENKETTGSAYQPIRDAKLQVFAPENFVENAYSKFGIKVENGKVIADTNSLTRDTTDVRALQKFLDDWGDKRVISPNEFLNMRKDLGNLSKFDRQIGKSKDVETIGKELYARVNETMRPQIPGLKMLDEQMSPQIEQFKKIRKDFLNADGTFKDGAVKKIGTALNKPELLARMEEVSPAITKRLEILKAIEDIERANGIKVGTYARGIFEGAGVLTGNIPMIIGAILTHPAIAVQILRGFGVVGKAVVPFLNYLNLLGGNLKIEEIPKAGKALGLTPDQIQGLINQRYKELSDFQKNSLKLPAPTTHVPAIRLPSGMIDPSGIKTIDAGVIKDQYGSKVGYTSTGKGATVNREYEPYTPTDKLPVIQMGSKPKSKSALPVIR